MMVVLPDSPVPNNRTFIVLANVLYISLSICPSSLLLSLSGLGTLARQGILETV